MAFGCGVAVIPSSVRNANDAKVGGLGRKFQAHIDDDKRRGDSGMTEGSEIVPGGLSKW